MPKSNGSFFINDNIYFNGTSFLKGGIILKPEWVIGIVGGVIVLLLIFGAPFKLFRLVGQGVIKILIGALLLFFLNAFGSNFGIHVPINLMTAVISGFLGIPGICALTVIQMWII